MSMEKMMVRCNCQSFISYQMPVKNSDSSHPTFSLKMEYLFLASRINLVSFFSFAYYTIGK